MKQYLNGDDRSFDITDALQTFCQYTNWPELWLTYENLRALYAMYDPRIVLFMKAQEAFDYYQLPEG
jgi:hypothetical protein